MIFYRVSLINGFAEPSTQHDAMLDDVSQATESYTTVVKCWFYLMEFTCDKMFFQMTNRKLHILTVKYQMITHKMTSYFKHTIYFPPSWPWQQSSSKQNEQ